MPVTRFAGFPTALIREAPNGKAVKQLLWGDHLSVLDAPAQGEWHEVRSRGVTGWMHKSTFEPERLLEIVFVDIGQGDGALIVTPDDRHLLIDAGEEDNLYRFLRWRYGQFKTPKTFTAAIITHSDQDHYYGFRPIFEDPKISFDSLFHNGIVERTGDDTLGPRAEGMLVDVIRTRAELEALLADAAVRGTKRYPALLWNLLQSGRLSDARALEAADGHLPGFAPGQSPSGLEIEVLSPVRDTADDGAARLKWFGDIGKTKNGHSVVLRLVYRDISVLLGGDLNIPAENHLLAKHTGYPQPWDEAVREAVLQGGRRVFRSDVAKACHHGSADFTDLFLQAVDPIVTVISSGDDEPYSHPRADALGAVGRWGRGRRPLVFSTELARSAPEAIKHPFAFRKQLSEANAALAAASPGPAKLKAEKALDALMEQIERSVAVYGAINLRSDGRRIVMAQKVEAPRQVDAAWDIYVLEPDAQGTLAYTTKYEVRD